MSETWKFETQSVHAGYSPDPTTKAVAGNIYTRIMSPTNDVLEKRVAALEGGIAALALASGQAAVTYAIQTIAEAGDNIIASTALFGERTKAVFIESLSNPQGTVPTSWCTR